jgi:hypothetical protein
MKSERQQKATRFSFDYLNYLIEQEEVVERMVDRKLKQLEPCLEKMIDEKIKEKLNNKH